MKYLSVCSGIEAATVAWHPLGWQAVAYSEIEPFPSAVLAHHYPDTPNLGDMTKYKEWDSGRIGAIDVLAGGTPCQSFSIAGLRKGLEDPRGNLMLTYLAIAERFKPRWIVWENVPGVLSSNRGRDFGTFLGALAKLGYGWAYRVLDAQWFGLAQRRRRVFVVGCLRDWQRAAKILFESESVCRDTPPDRSSQQALAKCLTSRAGSSGFDAETESAIVGRIEYCADVAGTLAAVDGPRGVGDQYSREGKLVATLCMSSRQKDAEITKEISPALTCLHEAPIVKCFYPSDARKRGAITLHDQVKTLTSQGKQGDSEPCFVREPSMGVRRLTPRECERLQGFPDDYTAIPWRRKTADQCPDGPRYKALGNSMAVPVMQWIGKRIAEEARDD
jgi:DNA (cytosine-5)-methyltransferase 1